MLKRGLTETSMICWRWWLHGDALKPWQQGSWLFVRIPAFVAKAGRVERREDESPVTKTGLR